MDKDKHATNDKPPVARLSVRQVRSGIGRLKRQKETLAALGLGRLNRVVAVCDTPAARGMIRRVGHLVEIVDAPSQPVRPPCD